MKSRELEWKISCASIVPVHIEKSTGMMEGDGGSSNPIHVQNLETRAPWLPPRDAEDHGKNADRLRTQESICSLSYQWLVPLKIQSTVEYSSLFYFGRVGKNTQICIRVAYSYKSHMET